MDVLLLFFKATTSQMVKRSNGQMVKFSSFLTSILEISWEMFGDYL